LEEGTGTRMISISIGIVIVVGIIGWIVKITSTKGHSLEYYKYMENNKRPPPSYFDHYVMEELIHPYRLKN